jgi:hypothetical protein
MPPARRGAIGAAISEPDPACCDRNCGGLLAQDPERTVAQAHRTGINLAPLLKPAKRLSAGQQVGGMSEAKPGIMSQRRVTDEPRSGCSLRFTVTLVSGHSVVLVNHAVALRAR